MTTGNLVSVTFSWLDYSIFVAMLTVSVGIGIYFGCFGSKQASASEYLMGGKKMHIFPIAMSLIASHISGITLLGVPADVYKYGVGYWLCIFSFTISTIITNTVYLPVLYEAQITSVYEYLEKRFDKKTRVFSSFLFGVSQILFLPIVVYIPALAFSAATGINLHLITPIICAVCIFYTTIGGLKAVVWTDALQFSVTLGAVATVLFLGVKATGGFGNVWKKAIEGGRLDVFGLDLDVTRRDTLWAPLIGLTFLWLSLTNTNQGCVQKLLSLSTLRDAKRTTIFYAIGMCVVKTASVITGLIIYAKYSNCDPFKTGQIKRNDQLLPFYVLDVAGAIPGLAGLFIAGVFSAGLSTLSAHLNCLSGTIFEDFVRKFVIKDITEQTKSNILKLIVAIAGIFCTALVFVFEHLGGILPMSLAFIGLTAGPLLGVFTLGILFRKANSQGAFYGGILGLILVSCLALPAKYLESQGVISYPPKPIGTDGCPFNVTIIHKTLISEEETVGIYVIFKICFYYYTFIGAALTLFLGLIISYSTKQDEKYIEESLFSPIIRKESTTKKQELPEYNTIENALKIVFDNSTNIKNVIKM